MDNKSTQPFKKILSLGILLFASSAAFAGEQADIADNSEWFTSLNTLLIISGSALFILAAALGYICFKVATTKEVWINKDFKKILSIAVLIGSSFAANAAEATEETVVQADVFNDESVVLIIINVVLLLLVYYLHRLSKSILKLSTGLDPITRDFMPSSESITGLIPIEREHEIMTDHEYDGIKELDNDLPPWWKGMFYISIVFAVLYVPYYHFGGGLLQEEEYVEEMLEAEIQKAEYMALKGSLVNENNVTVLTGAASLKNGAKIFKANCAACHGQLGEGMAGPNFTDEYWIHGGSINDIFSTIKYGVTDKGMISWQQQLSPVEINEVASYIMSLQGSNPPNAKEPQGVLYQPEAEEKQDSVNVEKTDSVSIDAN